MIEASLRALRKPVVRLSSKKGGERRLLILTYHRVKEGHDLIWPWDPDRETFRAHLQFLKDNCNVMTLAEARAALEEGGLPPAAICITFDDGYRDNFEIAFPELRAVNLRATFFIATGYLNGGAMWNDRIIEAVRNCRGGTIRLANRRTFTIGSDSDRCQTAKEIVMAVRYLSFTEREKVSAEIARTLGSTAPEEIMMTDDMVKALHLNGMEVGAHTESHPILSDLDPDAAWEEIASSKAALEKITGCSVSSFAYPNGRYGKDFLDRDMKLVENAGFDVAVSTNWGAVSQRSHRFALPRVGLSGNRNSRMWLQICRAYRTPDPMVCERKK